MAVLSGKAGTVTYNSASVAHVSGWEIDYKGAAVDVTGMSDSGLKTFIGGLTEWSGSFDATLDGAYTLPTPAASVAIALVDSADTGYNTYTGTVVTTGVKITNSVDGAVKINVTFQGSGALGIA